MSSQRYEVISKIAEGGLGSVYKAYDHNLLREVAIKRVKADTPEQAAKQAQELLAEAKTLSTLQHPHIVTIFDVGTDDEGNFIVMELLKGETLEDIVERGALNEEDFGVLVQQSLEGMIAAHDSGLIHLDIKPQNFMVIWLPSGKFQIKVLDFGLAKISQHPFYQETAEDGTILGSIYFMAPEQFEREPVDVRTDLYSLGCAYYFALTQHYPFQGETAAEVMGSHLYHSLVPLADLRPDLPSFLHRWVDWLMARKPNDRPKSAQEAWDTFKSHEFPFEKLVAKAAAPPPSHARLPSKSQPLQSSQQLRKSQPLQSSQQLRQSQALRNGPASSRPTQQLRSSQPVGGKVPGYTQALQNKVFPRPVAGPVNVSHAEAPDHLQKRSGASLWLKILLPALLLIVGGGGYFTYSMLKEREAKAFAYLTSQAIPKGSYDDLKLLVKYLDRPEHSAQAGEAIAKLQGISNEHLHVGNLFQDVESSAGISALSQAVAARKLPNAVTPLLQQFNRTKDSDARVSIWKALAQLATPDDFQSLLDKLSVANDKERHAAGEALRQVLHHDKNPSLRANAILDVANDSAKSEEIRAAAIESLGITGHEKAQTALAEWLKHPSPKLREAAVISVTYWPNSHFLEALQTLISAEFQASVRLPALKSFAAQLSKSGPTHQARNFAAFEDVYTNTREPLEENLLLESAKNVITPENLEFLKHLKSKKQELAERLTASETLIQTRLEVIQNAASDETEIQSSQTESQSENLEAIDSQISHWNESRASWLLNIPRSGKYQLQLQYQNTSGQRLSLLIGLGENVFRSTAELHNLASDGSSLTVGSTQIKEPGVYRLSLFVPQNEGNSQNFKIGNWTLIRLGD